MSKIVAFDVDGTLVQQQSSWVTVHQHYGTTEQARENLSLYKSGSIDYAAFMKLDIGLWPKPLHIAEVDKILGSYAFANHANEVVSELQKRGFEIVLISAGIDRLVCKVAQTLGLTHYLANGLEIDSKGYLTGHGHHRVELQHKEIALQNVLRDLNVMPEHCIAIGDSHYDLSFLQYAGKGIAVCSEPDPILKDYADIVKVPNLKEILDLL